MASSTPGEKPAPPSALAPGGGWIIPLGLLLLIGGAILLYWRSDLRPQTPPDNPQTSQAIRDARALQKQGDLETAIEIFEKHALQGYPEAMFHTGRAYARGWGVKPDLEKARHYFLLAVRYKFPGRGQTAYEIGRLFQRSSGPDCDTIAVEWFEKALQWGFVKASLQLSSHYEIGLGVKRNIDTAIQHYERASHAGYEKAKLNYAALLLSEKSGKARDPQRAAILINEAVASLERKAMRGSASAAKQLGRLYRDGIVVETNRQTHRWLLHAALLGSSGAMHDLARLLLGDKEHPEHIPKALDWLRNAADHGHGGAMTSLGRFHLKQAYGLERAGALTWFNKGVSAGHSGSMKELAHLYRAGDLVPRDLDEALRLATLGSQNGHTGSTSLLKSLQAEAALEAPSPTAHVADLPDLSGQKQADNHGL